MTGDDPERHPGSRVLTEAAWTWLLVGVSLAIALASLMWLGPSPAPQNETTAPGGSSQATQAVIKPEMVPLATGEEPLPQLFKQAGCPVCHTIPGIDAGEGRVGPRLVLKKTGPERLGDPDYRGQAKTVREYIIESILNPGIYIVPGYPALAMPRWYGKKLSAAAVDKIAGYLEQQTEGETGAVNR
jgi:mono/diheme cytochrome c family protein